MAGHFLNSIVCNRVVFFLVGFSLMDCTKLVRFSSGN